MSSWYTSNSSLTQVVLRYMVYRQQVKITEFILEIMCQLVKRPAPGCYYKSSECVNGLGLDTSTFANTAVMSGLQSLHTLMSLGSWVSNYVDPLPMSIIHVVPCYNLYLAVFVSVSR